MKKQLKIIITFSIMALLIIGYYFYLSNRDVTSGKKKDAERQEVEELIAKRLDTNYPGTPIEVMNMYLRIAKAYYRTELSDKEIEGLGKQARVLFDEELLEKNPYDEHMESLKKDIKDFNKNDRYITDFKVARNSEIKYTTLAQKHYATVNVLVYLRDGSKLIPVYMDFTLRKDAGDNWKILFWEKSKAVSAEDTSKATE